MRKHSFHWLQQAVFLLLAAPLMMGLSACSDDDDVAPAEEEMTEEEKALQEQVSKYDAMNIVVRALAEIDELPDDWETAVFKAEVGKVLDEAYPDVRSVAAESVEGAVSYFMSITPDDEVEETVTGYTWKHDGVGQLTLVRTGSDNCFATIQVNLPQMPDLKEVRLVPAALLADNASKPPYYHMGDVLTDKNGAHWICIRPANRAKGKDKVYFASFDPSLIKTKTINVKLKLYDDDNKKLLNTPSPTQGDWVYGTNFLEKRMAIAAGHTFGLLGLEYDATKDSDFSYKTNWYCIRRTTSIDIDSLRVNAHQKIPQVFNTYLLAYGGPVSNSNTKLSQVKYLQPILTVATTMEGDDIRQEVTPYFPNPSEGCYSKLEYSLTEDYDPMYYPKFGMIYIWAPDDVEHPIGIGVPFNIKNYVSYHNQNTLLKELLYNHAFDAGFGVQDFRVLLMTQMSFKDTGKANTKYHETWRASDDQAIDYWKSLEKTTRTITKKGATAGSLQPETNLE